MWVTDMEPDQLLQSRFYSGLHNQIQDGMRDMMLPPLWRQLETLRMTKPGNGGNGKWLLRQHLLRDLGDPPSGPGVSAKPLLEAKSQMRAFMKEVSAWILDCKVWNAECWLARANNTQMQEPELALMPGAVVKIVTMGKSEPLSTNQPRGAQGRIIIAKTIMIMHPNRIGHKPNTASNVMVDHPCVTNVGGRDISAITAWVSRITMNKDRYRDNLNYWRGGAEPSPPPREQPQCPFHQNNQ